jgi:hypothetical protein
MENHLVAYDVCLGSNLVMYMSLHRGALCTGRDNVYDAGQGACK